jgi:hypothetical protein
MAADLFVVSTVTFRLRFDVRNIGEAQVTENNSAAT